MLLQSLIRFVSGYPLAGVLLVGGLTGCANAEVNEDLPMVQNFPTVSSSEFLDFAEVCATHFPDIPKMQNHFAELDADFDPYEFENFSDASEYPPEFIEGMIGDSFIFGEANARNPRHESSANGGFGRGIEIAEDFVSFYEETPTEICSVSARVADPETLRNEPLAWLATVLPGDADITTIPDRPLDYSGTFMRDGLLVTFKYNTPSLRRQDHPNYCGKHSECLAWTHATFDVEIRGEPSDYRWPSASTNN